MQRADGELLTVFLALFFFGFFKILIDFLFIVFNFAEEADRVVTDFDVVRRVRAFAPPTCLLVGDRLRFECVEPPRGNGLRSLASENPPICVSISLGNLSI